MDRRRINLSVTPKQYGELEAIASQYGFASVTQMSAMVLMLFLKYRRKQRVAREQSDNEYITEMFSHLQNEIPKDKEGLKMIGYKIKTRE